MSAPAAFRPYVYARQHACEYIALAPAATAAGAARRFVADLLGRWALGRMEESALPVTSELVTNAVTAGADSPGLVHLYVRALDASVVIEVWDTSQEAPAVPAAAVPADAEHGRGLLVVQKLSRRWGYSPEGAGKVVWAELPMRPFPDLPRRRRTGVRAVPLAVHADRALLRRLLICLERL